MIFVETTLFTRHVIDLFDDSEYATMQAALVRRPDLGNIIPGSAGLRKIRWAAKGHGKSGGARIIYFWVVAEKTILMLAAYPKNVKADLTQDEIKRLSQVVSEEYR